MLNCPQCNFENPDQNRFCQQCGCALQVWRALILLRGTTRSAASGPSQPEDPLFQSNPVGLTASTEITPLDFLDLRDLLSEPGYLDTQKRYRILGEAIAQPLGNANAFALTIMDCQPAAESPLADLQDRWLQAAPDDSSLCPPTLPPEAIPYLALQAHFYPTVPTLHHAWETPTHAVLLIEDRTQWPLLKAQWQTFGVAPLQQVSWLYKISELWDALSTWHIQSALGDLDNLRVDEDQILCVAHLQPSENQEGSRWQILGDICQRLRSPLPESSRNPEMPAPLLEVIQALENGQIATIQALQGRLIELADIFQAVDSTPESFVPSDIPGDAPGSDAALSRAEHQNPVVPEAVPEKPAAISLTSVVSPVAPFDPSEPAAEATAGSTSDKAPSVGWEEILLVDPLDRDPMAMDPLAMDPLDIDRLDMDSLDDLDNTAPISWSEEMEDSLDLPTMVLPMQIITLDEAGQTHGGRQREHNEDFFSTQTELKKQTGPQGTTLRVKGLYILCDGMGGHASGEVASRLAVKTLQDYFVPQLEDGLPDEATLVDGIVTANQAIYDINQENECMGSGRMGTTLVMLLLKDDKAAVAHVGDSRLYAYTRRSGLRQLTVDHEVGQREIQRGVEPAIAYARPDAYQLTQALGPRGRNDLKPGITFLDIIEDTLFILCSDGLSDNDLLEQHCETHVEPLLHSQADLDEGAARLIEIGNQHNGHDNITVVLVRLRLRPNMEKITCR